MIIEENSIQLPQHPAYHTIGLSYLMKEIGTADGRQDDVSSVSIDRVRRQYLAIRAEGCLRPALEKEESSMCFEDRIAGDDSYVFLSVREKDWTSLPGQACFGFIFDAYSLIDKGAILAQVIWWADTLTRSKSWLLNKLDGIMRKHRLRKRL